ncbi:MAG: FG-GAP-like repeat-containing protein, partial [Bacteroidota bacterium]
MDLFITSGVNSVPIMKNAGNGVFTRISNPIVGRNPDNLPQTIAITSGDFNNDGNIDLAVTTVNPLAISILYQINDSVTPPDLLYPPDGIVGLSLNPILRWNDSSGSAINYRLQVSLDSLFASFVIDTTVTINQWQFNGILHNDTTYYWRVNETNYLKESEFSTTFKFTIDMPFEVTGVDLGSWFASSAEWGDFDNDGDLDLLCTGGSNNSVPFNFKSRIFRNDGNGQFVNINSGIVPVGFGNATWGDYDNDGDLDVLVVGPTNEWPYYIGVAKIYKNNGNGNFIDINAAIQPPGCCTGIWEGLNQQGDTECSGVWADLDNDGDLDVIISGIMYENLGNDQFIRVENGIHSIGLGSIDLGDYDRDNDLDLLVCGRVTFNDMQTIVYRNDGHFNFTQMNFDLVGIEFGSARWGDYNNDGFLDILVNGNRGGNIQNEIYQNINGNDFVQIASGLPDICLSSGIWGDYNSDGLLDIAISGWNGIEVFTRVYKNSGMNNFTNIEGGFWGTAWNSGENMAWGDYDNDGDIDLIVTGSNLNNTGFNNSILYRNLMDTPNTPPSVPTNLNSQVLCNSVILNWDKSTDQTTPQSGISYNILLGTTPGGGQIVSSNSEYPGGFRKVANFGNTGHNSSWRIDSLSPGTYYWCVQAIDNSFGGSPFSVVDSFTVIGFPIPEPAGQISGLTTVCFGQTDVIYSIQEIANATGYVWNVPAGVTITAGYNTNSITVNFTNTAVSGKFTVYGTIGCVNSIVSPDFMVTVSSGFTCGSSIIINHVADTVAPVTKTVTYSIVNNIPGEPSKCWITSNLGADHQATSVDDATEESAGWYWQFNRKQGYKHDGINRTPNNAWVNPIIEDFDWQAANDPCTHEIGGGWRVPT